MEHLMTYNKNHIIYILVFFTLILLYPDCSKENTKNSDFSSEFKNALSKGEWNHVEQIVNQYLDSDEFIPHVAGFGISTEIIKYPELLDISEKLIIKCIKENTLENLRKVVGWLINNQHIKVIVHLGDNYDDTNVFENLNAKIIKVPGVFSSYYQDNDIPNRVIEIFNGRKVLITHTEYCHENDLPDDIKPEELVSKKAVDVVLYGHSHIPRIEQKQSILYINPGHLKTEDKKGYPPSVAVIDFNDQIQANIFNLSGRLIQSKIF